MKNISALIAGLLFGIGLSVSGMINPDKVIGFLDLAGNWDYALAFVMGGAVILNLVTFHFILKRKSPLLMANFDMPQRKEITPRLIFGAILLGLGWGLAGICPGPAVVNLVTLKTEAFVFVGSMLVGMVLFRLTQKYWAKLG